MSGLFFDTDKKIIYPFIMVGKPVCSEFRFCFRMMRLFSYKGFYSLTRKRWVKLTKIKSGKTGIILESKMLKLLGKCSQLGSLTCV